MSRRALAAALTVAALALAPSRSSAQVRFRAELGATFAPWRRWQFSLSERLVVGQSIPSTGRWQTLAGVSYSPWKFLSLGVAYRLSAQAGDDGLDLAHRALAQAAATGQCRRFRFGWRLRAQGIFDEDAAQVRFTPTIRNRALVRVRLAARLSASVSGEIFSDLGGNKTHAFDRLRAEAFVTARLDPFEVALGYRYDTSLRDADAYHMPMVALFYHWEAPRPTRHAEGGDEHGETRDDSHR